MPILYIIYAILLAPKFMATKQSNISGILGDNYGEATRLMVSVINIVAMIVVTVVMYVGGGATITGVTGIPIQIAVIIAGVLAVLNVVFGGIRGVGLSNIIHATVKYAGILIVVYVAYVMLKLTFPTLPPRSS